MEYDPEIPAPIMNRKADDVARLIRAFPERTFTAKQVRTLLSVSLDDFLRRKLLERGVSVIEVSPRKWEYSILVRPTDDLLEVGCTLNPMEAK